MERGEDETSKFAENVEECLKADWFKKRQAFDEHMVHSIPGIKDLKFAENNWQNILKQI